MSNWKIITGNYEQDRYDELECRKCGYRTIINHRDSQEMEESKLKHKCLSRRISSRWWKLKRKLGLIPKRGLFE